MKTSFGKSKDKEDGVKLLLPDSRNESKQSLGFSKNPINPDDTVVGGGVNGTNKTYYVEESVKILEGII